VVWEGAGAQSPALDPILEARSPDGAAVVTMADSARARELGPVVAIQAAVLDRFGYVFGADFFGG
jgi:hypothetical protein